MPKFLRQQEHGHDVSLKSPTWWLQVNLVIDCMSVLIHLVVAHPFLMGLVIVGCC